LPLNLSYLFINALLSNYKEARSVDFVADGQFDTAPQPVQVIE
jgi:hypothetical protein